MYDSFAKMTAMGSKPKPKPKPTGQSNNVRIEAAKRIAAELKAKRAAAKKVHDSYKLPGGGTKYDSYGKKNMFSIPGPKG
jgi:hypothetical protein